MKKNKLLLYLIILIVALSGIFVKTVNANESENNLEAIKIKYSSHIQDYGWEKDFSKKDGEMSGTEGESKRVEAIKISLGNNEKIPKNAVIKYQVHVEDYGWMDWKQDGEIAGTQGESKRIEAIKIKLEGLDNASVEYRTHVQDIGWTDWTNDGKISGTEGQSKRIEAIEIKLNIKESQRNSKIKYYSHIEDYGWEEEYSRIDGETSGTEGKSKRVEAIKISLGNDKEISKNSNIKYQVHVEDYGWMNWKENGQVAGTVNEAKRIEAIKIKLENLDCYSVLYRTHVQDVGWTKWSCDGEVSGTTGKGLRVEAIEIKIVKTLTASAKYSYNDTENKVQVSITSNKELNSINDEKWDLDYTKKIYTKSFNKNGNYTVIVTDIEGMSKKIDIKVSDIMEGKIRYSSHVEDYGWQNWKQDGQITGTTGESKRVEAIKIDFGNSDVIPQNAIIKYQVHIQDIGWQEYKQNGQIAGTQGQAKRIEAIKIQLEGIEGYTVKYRTHVQDIGWTNWSYNGNISGTEGKGLRIEAIQIEITNNKENVVDLDSSKYPGYKELIEKILVEHPNWRFKFLNTGLKFSDAVNGEYKIHAANLIETTAGEWLCPICGTKQYYPGWYGASDKAIAYYMDPRNFLNESNVFQFLDVNEYNEQSVSLHGIQNRVNNTFLRNNANDINIACKNQNVNPYYVIARLIQENSDGGSATSSGMRADDGKLYYNPFNIGANGDDVIGNALKVARNNRLGFSRKSNRRWNNIFKEKLARKLSKYIISK